MFIRIPQATVHNKKDFCAAWIYYYGGSYNNAYRVWRVEVHKNAKSNLGLSQKELLNALSV